MKPATLKDYIILPFIMVLHAPFAILGYAFLKAGEFLLDINNRLPKINTVMTEKRKAEIARMREEIRRGSQVR